jgi:ubiquinone/menaquinone biosynthesis C-methylase UbiE
MYQPEKYWDEVSVAIAARDAANAIAGDDDPYYRYKRGRFLALFNSVQVEGKRVLEIGCGPGGNLAILHEKKTDALHGVDISGAMIALAGKNLSGKNITLTKINGTHIPFEAGYFHLAFTSTVLQHITDEKMLQQLIENICRVTGESVYIFERIEQQLTGHESNTGRPVAYYSSLFANQGFSLKKVKFLDIRCSYYVCGAIRKIFNSKHRKEGEPMSKISLLLQRILLPLTRRIDPLIPVRRDLAMLHFVKEDVSG